MALYRQGSGPYQVGMPPPGNGDHRPGSPFRLHDHVKAEQKGYLGLVRSRSMKAKRLGRSSRSRKCSIGAIALVLLVGVVVTIFGTDYVFPLVRNFKGESSFSALPDVSDEGGWEIASEDKTPFASSTTGVKVAARESHEITHRERGISRQTDTGRESASEADRSSTFGKNRESFRLDHDLDARLDADPKNWDNSDRQKEGSDVHDKVRSEKLELKETGEKMVGLSGETKSREDRAITLGLDHEYGRKEPRKYSSQFRSSNHDNRHGSSLFEVYSDADMRKESRDTHTGLDKDGFFQQELKNDIEEMFEVDHDENTAENTDTNAQEVPTLFLDKFADDKIEQNMTFRKANEDDDPGGSISSLTSNLKADEDPRFIDFLREAQLYAHRTDPSVKIESRAVFKGNSGKLSKALKRGRRKNVSSAVAGQDTEVLNQYDDTPHDDDMSRSEEDEEELVQQEQLPGKSKKKKKRTTLPCEISFLNTTKGLREPTDSSRFESFSLKYWEMEEKPEDDSLWEPRFAGHQTLLEREDSFVAKDQTLHCGFVKAPDGYRGTGFEISKDDMDYLQTCHIAVSSCIFGNYDHIRNPSGKKVTSASKKKVCFAMFVDQPSLDGMIEEGESPDENMNLGLWRIVLIKNAPYSDNRRTGKVPKFLTHRLFPNARYSVWLDSKLRLQSDPLLILEYFLWRGHHEYAISNHYDRHCVWEEVEQNKKLNKFNHSVIDQQFAFYQADGLIRFNASDPEKLLPSHVPEGSFIVRAHTPMSNLFSCLWFNEVDRFTPRDQLSFAYTYMKLVRTNPNSQFRLHMFKDCERKAMAKLYRHKTEDALVKGRRH
ncbi:protein MpEMB2756 [Marchantia polymorpha subsp. ruderalis]|uniref:TOD1/MUCI70 glycosyltransferase-like domain-containing protein n=3 Tax=Marchantia polymorpha TaxID=3197 RepID=A0A176W454_MARPO|nr:hypothetical protein AXG93_1881s1040 [Marchantia polymorpha subsp. ruderalis]PTQ49629.1 hypothetical protein MARPO_0002s0109 [Marchantia polymorpha]BBN00254.1 hypothetical protein Mp_1g27690 [Marchantia polymorpha subsp. ruderalis]|eukprot:PTQ49629.1 hypothetical protein MARPO_0002s0109 [Marchantia polymorpha]